MAQSEKWMQAASKKMAKKGTKGSFTKFAKDKGESTGEAADQVMSDTGSYSPAVVKKANFAKNVAKSSPSTGLQGFIKKKKLV